MELPQRGLQRARRRSSHNPRRPIEQLEEIVARARRRVPNSKIRTRAVASRLPDSARARRPGARRASVGHLFTQVTSSTAQDLLQRARPPPGLAAHGVPAARDPRVHARRRCPGSAPDRARAEARGVGVRRRRGPRRGAEREEGQGVHGERREEEDARRDNARLLAIETAKQRKTQRTA